MPVTSCFKKSWVKEKGKELNFRNSEPRVPESDTEPGNSHRRTSHLAGHRPLPAAQVPAPTKNVLPFMMEFFFPLFFHLPRVMSISR